MPCSNKYIKKKQARGCRVQGQGIERLGMLLWVRENSPEKQTLEESLEFLNDL